jgi:DNA primase catalytic subunit
MNKLSQLQRYILKKSLGHKKGGIDKNIFFKFYESIKNKPKDIENVIIKSLNRLIERDLIIAFCKKTKHKTFINKILLTTQGKRIAKKLLGTQEKLPIKYKKIKKK